MSSSAPFPVVLRVRRVGRPALSLQPNDSLRAIRVQVHRITYDAGTWSGVLAVPLDASVSSGSFPCPTCAISTCPSGQTEYMHWGSVWGQSSPCRFLYAELVEMILCSRRVAVGDSLNKRVPGKAPGGE